MYVQDLIKSLKVWTDKNKNKFMDTYAFVCLSKGVHDRVTGITILFQFCSACLTNEIKNVQGLNTQTHTQSTEKSTDDDK